MNLSNLPPWALPVGGGALLGVGVLLTRGRHAATPVTVPVTGQGPGTVTQPTDALLSGFTKTITDLFTAGQKAQQEQEAAYGKSISDLVTAEAQGQAAQSKTITDLIASLAAQQNTAQSGFAKMLQDMFASEQTNLQSFFENFTSAQSASLDTIGQEIAAQQAQQTAQNKTFFDAMKAWEDQLAKQLADLAARPASTPGTNAPSLIDRLKQSFSAAFQRLPSKPVGTPVANSDITIGDFGSNAPYKQDTGFTYYDTTGFLVTGPFRQFLGNFGGARTYGRPISQVFRDFDGFDTQVFEHAIFKFVPNSNPGQYDIRVIQIV
jgi:hypothetical protein